MPKKPITTPPERLEEWDELDNILLSHLVSRNTLQTKEKVLQWIRSRKPSEVEVSPESVDAWRQGQHYCKGYNQAISDFLKNMGISDESKH